MTDTKLALDARPEAGWAALRKVDRLEELEPDRSVDISASGRLELAFGLPMPAISLVELLPAR